MAFHYSHLAPLLVRDMRCFAKGDEGIMKACSTCSPTWSRATRQRYKGWCAPAIWTMSLLTTPRRTNFADTPMGHKLTRWAAPDTDEPCPPMSGAVCECKRDS